MIQDTMTAEAALRKYFGHEGFRSGQKELIAAVLGGRDVLGIMPTGGGKSVCYQVPAVILPGITLVISPLISLMKDQLFALKQAGIPAAYINSTLSPAQVELVIANARAGKYKIIYVAPERLLSPRFTGFCMDAEISLIAVDEAHCVSQWGQDFRSVYTYIADFVGMFRVRPVVAAFTATATERVREDIVSLLRLDRPQVTLSGFDRENLFFEVRHPKNRYAELLAFLSKRKSLYGIVYCSTRKTVEEVCAKLTAGGYRAARYHAGLDDDERHRAQDDFIYDRVNIVVATNAFGMGIDKSNVSFVVHYNMPKDIESYYQEAGRAGRDGSDADCVILYSGQDMRTNLFLIENGEGKTYKSEEQKLALQSEERRRLKNMDLYCHTGSCLRNYILNYFGDKTSGDCGRCGNCAKPAAEYDVSETAKKIMSCVVSTNEFYGKNTVIDILRGSRNAKILSAGLDRRPVYGSCRESDAELKDIVNHLIEQGYLLQTDGKYPIIKRGQRADEIVSGGARICLRRKSEPAEAVPLSKLKKASGKTANVPNGELFSRLKALRKTIADRQGVPPYVVFHDSTLAEMCACLPETLDEFARLSGVGAQKLDKYGRAFIDIIKSYGADE